MKPTRILVPEQKIGGKPFLLRASGMFVLEEGPGMLQVCNITHAGSGELDIWDGVPSDNGMFEDEHLPETDPKFGRHNGRKIMQFSPVYMGAWMMNAGFEHGLTIRASGLNPPFITFVWVAFKRAQPVKSVITEKLTPKSDIQLTNHQVKDVKAPPAPGSLMRSTCIDRIGFTRVARRTAEIYSVMIGHSGSFCRMILRNGFGTPLFDMFSTFTGSFVLAAGSENGIIVDIEGKQQPPSVQLNWREPDLQMV